MTQQTTTTAWQHPTGKQPKTVLLVALGPTKQTLLEQQTAHVPPPLLMDADEVWALNAAVNWFAGRVHWDCLFVLDHLDGERAKYPSYVDQIATWAGRHQAPVITSDAGACRSLPHIHEYPITDIVQATGGQIYYHNSIPLILAYAWAIGVKRIVLYGADYSHERAKRREDDRPNAEYWIGWCRAQGMQIITPDTSSLLNGDQPHRIYGYPRWPDGLEYPA